jgi:hypothetical protein
VTPHAAADLALSHWRLADAWRAKARDWAPHDAARADVALQKALGHIARARQLAVEAYRVAAWQQ